MKGWKRTLLASLLGFSLLFSFVGGSGADELKHPLQEPFLTPEGTEIDPLAARLNDEGALAIREVTVQIGKRQEEVGKAIVSAATWRLTAVERVGKVQEQTAEIIHRNTALLFEKLDRLGRVQEELGNLIRDQASLRFETVQKIESVRAGLDQIMAESAAHQIAISERLGKGQEEVGEAILATLLFPAGSLKRRRSGWVWPF